ncbi:nucleotidyl transferase AbiEii/AbiGii toxin family protein, partial [Flavobacterium sp. UBA5153]|uniref:nucleotidyl transferase AbiEii/AbiGii toxin family protein n=1 Tax=Flavobacterium sp. UBA5153 TaxID=1946549 RepID=UPI0025BE0B24
YYTDDYVFEEITVDTVRMASIEEIIAMKLDVVLRGGRKKDFWDLHYFLNTIPPWRYDFVLSKTLSL